MEFSIYQLARQRIAGATIKAPTKKVSLSECRHLVKAKEPKKPRDKHEPTPEEIEERKARQRKYSHEWYLKHKAECTAKSREWARNNREKVRNFSRNYYWSHREERNAASKKWRDEHKDIYNARMRAYRKRQKEKNQAQDP
jgi:hypothetical protein